MRVCTKAAARSVATAVILSALGCTPKATPAPATVAPEPEVEPAWVVLPLMVERTNVMSLLPNTPAASPPPVTAPSATLSLITVSVAFTVPLLANPPARPPKISGSQPDGVHWNVTGMPL